MNLLRLLEDLEAGSDPYLTLEEAQRATGEDLSDLIAQGMLLVDHRHHLTPTGAPAALTLCRLNRHHPQVKALASWD